MQMIKYNHHPV